MRALFKSIPLASALTATLAQAHEGHGLHGSHWHATDTGGWVMLALLVALGLWFSRK